MCNQFGAAKFWGEGFGGFISHRPPNKGGMGSKLGRKGPKLAILGDFCRY